MTVVTYPTCERLQMDTVPPVTSVSAMGCDEALSSLLDLCRRYRTVRATVQRESSDVGAFWTPIYIDLLNELRREIEIAAQHYTDAADDAGVEARDRVDWQHIVDV